MVLHRVVVVQGPDDLLADVAAQYRAEEFLNDSFGLRQVEEREQLLLVDEDFFPVIRIGYYSILEEVLEDLLVLLDARGHLAQAERLRVGLLIKEQVNELVELGPVLRPDDLLQEAML